MMEIKSNHIKYRISPKNGGKEKNATVHSSFIHDCQKVESTWMFAKCILHEAIYMTAGKAITIGTEKRSISVRSWGRE